MFPLIPQMKGSVQRVTSWSEAGIRKGRNSPCPKSLSSEGFYWSKKGHEADCTIQINNVKWIAKVTVNTVRVRFTVNTVRVGAMIRYWCFLSAVPAWAKLIALSKQLHLLLADVSLLCILLHLILSRIKLQQSLQQHCLYNTIYV